MVRNDVTEGIIVAKLPYDHWHRLPRRAAAAWLPDQG